MRAVRVLALVALATLILSTGCSRNLLTKAQQFELEGKPANALLLYQEALDKTPERDLRKRSAILLRTGDCLYQLGRIPEAFSAFQKASDSDRNNQIANLRLGELYLAAGAPERAREQALFVLGRVPTNHEAMALLGAASAESDQPEVAKQSYERVLQSDPKRVAVAVALADLYNREDNIVKAREVLKRASAALPGSPVPLLALARLEEQQGNGGAAELAYRHAVSVQDSPETNLRLSQFLQRNARIAEAEQVLRRVDSQQPGSPVALADFHLSAGRTTDAIDQYLTALQRLRPVVTKQQEASPDIRNRGLLLARMIEAEITDASARDANSRTRALTAIRKRLESFRADLDPATVAMLDAQVALADNNLVLAQVFAGAALDLAPDSAAAHYIAGCVAAANGNDDLALTEWQSAVDIDAHYTPARLALGEKALAAGDSGQADLQARLAVRDDPGNVRGLLLFSRALLLQDKPSAAAAIAQRAAALNPMSVEPTLILGEAVLKLGRIPEALLAFQRAVVTQPESEEAIQGLLRVYRRGSISYSALANMEKVAKQPPVSTTLLEITGRLYAERGWHKEAIRSLVAAVKADPKRATAARLLAQLQLSTGDVSSATQAASRVGGKSEFLLNAYHAEQSGKTEAAITAYEKALRDGDKSGIAANNLAWLYASLGQNLDRALELAGAATKASPNNPAVLDTLGFVFLQRREYSSAVKILETAVRLASIGQPPAQAETVAQIRKHLTEAYFAAGQTEAAFQLTQNRRPSSLK